MRVCHVMSGLDPVNGGTATALAGLAQAQARAGLEVTVAATWVDPPRPDVATPLEAAGVKVRLLGPCTNPMSRHPDLARFVAELVGGADVVHIHALWEAVQHRAAVESRRAGVPYVWTPHGMLSPWSLAQSRWRKKLYMAMRLRRDLNGAAAIHFTAEQEHRLTRGLGLTAPTIVETNGVDLREFEQLPEPGRFRAKHPELAGKRLVVCLGRIDRQKGMDVLIPAFARAAVPDAVLLLVGPDLDGYGAELRKIVDRLGAADRIMFTGPLYGPDRVAALVDAELFALTSYHENFGIAVVEALAVGTPVIVSDQVNIHAEIAAAGVGAVVPLDVDRVADELRRWMGDARLRDEAARRARPFVWDNYDWDPIAGRWAGHYLRIVAGRNG